LEPLEALMLPRNTLEGGVGCHLQLNPNYIYYTVRIPSATAHGMCLWPSLQPE